MHYNIAFIGVRLLGLFLVASNLDHVASWIALMATPLNPVDSAGIPISTIRAISTATLLPPLAGLLLWFSAKSWCKVLHPPKAHGNESQESVDIIRASCFMLGLYLLLSSVPALIIQSSQFVHYGPELYNAHELPPYIEPAIRCLFGLFCLLGSNVVRELFNRFRQFGR